VSGAAVTRWQKAKTEADKRGCDGVIPEIRRAQIIAIAKLEGKVIRKRDFLKA
jgi:hypothetical protein